MGYNKKTWADGETITAHALNNMDNGVAEAHKGIAALKVKMKNEESRINNLSSLKEGSTTGDAELIDGRMDYNGETWPNIGEHIRGITEQEKGSRNFPYPFTMDSTLKRPLDNTPVYTEKMNGIIYLKVYACDTDTYYISQLYSYSTSGNCCIRIDRADGGRYGFLKHAVESKENREVENITIYDGNGEMLAEVVVDWNKIITNIGVGLDETSTKISEGCMCRMKDISACVYGNPTIITEGNYEELIPSMDSVPTNRIITIAGAPIPNHPQKTTNAGGTAIALSPYTESGQDGEVQQFVGRYGELYTRIKWSGKYTQWHMESYWGRLAGKSLYCDGDSIAAGYRRGTNEWQMPYGEQIAEKYSMILTNAAVGGTTLAVRKGRTDSICERVKANLANTKQEYIIIDGGINDVFNKIPMGQMIVSDKIWEEAYDTSTTIGALETLCKFLITKQPEAKKFFVLTHATLGDLSVQDIYFEEMRKVLKKWGIEPIDIRRKAGMIPLTDTIKKLFFYKKEDGTLDHYHITKKAYAQLYVPHIEDKMFSM